MRILGIILLIFPIVLSDNNLIFYCYKTFTSNALRGLGVKLQPNPDSGHATKLSLNQSRILENCYNQIIKPDQPIGQGEKKGRYGTLVFWYGLHGNQHKRLKLWCAKLKLSIIVSELGFSFIFRPLLPKMIKLNSPMLIMLDICSNIKLMKFDYCKKWFW